MEFVQFISLRGRVNQLSEQTPASEERAPWARVIVSRVQNAPEPGFCSLVGIQMIQKAHFGSLCLSAPRRPATNRDGPEQPVEVLHPDADESLAESRRGELACGDAAAEGVDADAIGEGGLLE